MIKLRNKAAAVAVLAGAAMAMATFSADARSRCEQQGTCRGPVVGTKMHTSYKYNTVRRVRNVTRYRDVNRPRHVTNVHRIVNVTRVQPVTRINTVTRVHNRTANLYETRHGSQTRMLPGQSVTNAKTIQMGGNIPSPKVHTTYRYNTVQRVNNVTRYHDVNRTQYVKHINRVVNVTRVQPVTHTNVVTRIHDRPVITSRVVQVHRTEMLPTRTIRTGKVMQTNYKSRGEVDTNSGYKSTDEDRED